MNYGYIERLEVKESEPIFNPETLVWVEIKLDVDDCARPEVGLADFTLPDEILRLMARLDEIQNGTIEKIDVRAGIPTSAGTGKSQYRRSNWTAFPSSQNA
jgi:hypothetical protein